MKFIFTLLISVSFLSAQDWVVVQPADSSFSVEMPGKPQEQKKVVDSDIGKLDVFLYIYEQANSGYIVSYNDYPESAMNTNVVPDSVYNNAARSALASTRGTLISKNKITYRGHPGIELKYSIPGNVLVRSRYFLVNNRLFQLMAIGNEETLYNSFSEWFFNSLKIKKAVVAPLAERLFKAINYTYDRNENGSYSLTLSFEDKRTQLVHVYPMVASLNSRPAYDVWSTITRYKKTIPDSIVQDMFVRNSNLEYGHFQSYPSDSSFVLVYSVIFHGELTAEIFKTIINEVAGMADYYESKLSREDTY